MGRRQERNGWRSKERKDKRRDARVWACTQSDSTARRERGREEEGEDGRRRHSGKGNAKPKRTTRDAYEGERGVEPRGGEGKERRERKTGTDENGRRTLLDPTPPTWGFATNADLDVSGERDTRRKK